MSEWHDGDKFVNFLRKQSLQVLCDKTDTNLVSYELVSNKGPNSSVFQAIIQIDVSVYQSVMLAEKLFTGYDCAQFAMNLRLLADTNVKDFTSLLPNLIQRSPVRVVPVIIEFRIIHMTF